MNPEWHLIDGIDGTLICKFFYEDVARNWLDKQIKDFPNGYFVERQARIERYPPLEGQLEFNLAI